MRMITLVLSYRFGLHSAERVQWDDTSRCQNCPVPDSGESLIRLGQALQRESEVSQSRDKVANP